MAYTTRLVLCTSALNRADMAASSFVSATEIAEYVQDGYRALYDMLVGAYQDYYVADAVAFTLTSSNAVAIAADFKKLLGVDYDRGGGDWIELDPFAFNDRNSRTDMRRGLPGKERRYRLLGTNLKIVPADDYAGSYRYWYVPACPVLTADATQLDMHADQWKDYIVACAAIKCLAKEESDTADVVAEKAELAARIMALAINRDAGRSERVVDVRGGDCGPYGGGRAF